MKSQTMNRIFVSYRRGDEAGWTTNLTDALKERFGDASVFKDSDEISSGEDFTEQISNFLATTNALVVVIGRRWRGKKTWLSRARIWESEDWVRKELEFASKNIPNIFPVLVNGATLPKADDLPPTLAFLPNLQAFELRRDYWEGDVKDFIAELQLKLEAQGDALSAVAFRRDELAEQQKRRRTYHRVRMLFYSTVLLVLGSLGGLKLYSYLSELSLLTSAELNRLDELTYGGYPRSVSAGRTKVLVNKGYAVGYSTERNNPLWAVFRIMGLRDGRSGFRGFKRPELFRSDRRLPSPVEGIRFGRGWDRGQLVSQMIMSEQIGPEGQLESFLMTNVSPQSPNLNRHVWAKAERFLPEAANAWGHLFVITGPIFDDAPKYVQFRSERKIQIPVAFYMIILDLEQAWSSRPKFRLIAYRFDQNVSRTDDFRDRTKFGVSVDQIEAETGLDFFPELSKRFESWEEQEGTVENSHWE